MAGTENDGLKGVGGRVWGRDVVPPMNVSALCLPVGEVIGGAIAERLPRSREGVVLGDCDCGRDRSYDSCGAG